MQILSALNRLPDAVEPLRTLLKLTPAADRPGLIAALPRFFGRGSDPAKTAALLEDVLAVYARDPPRACRPWCPWAAAGWRPARATRPWPRRSRRSARTGPPQARCCWRWNCCPRSPRPSRSSPPTWHAPTPSPALRLACVRTLTQQQRYADAVRELEIVTRQKPDLAPPFLSLGALHLELRHPKEGEAALLRYVELAQAQRADAAAPAATAASAADNGDADDDTRPPRPEQGLIQAWLMLAQAAEQRGDFKAAEAWLAKIDDPQRALEVQTRRASMLARQGRIEEAREVVRATPERDADDARAKLLAEAGVLRDVKRWKEALEVLSSANERFPDDTDLLYEQAMMAEKLNRMDEMERLLRRVIELKPDSAQAYNALGYSLADRRVRLPEARELIKKALELTPGDPFITDSLGWVEYRLGNREEALRLLRQAYAARPDPEIAAHLGEVLWAFGQQDEARKVWIEARAATPATTCCAKPWPGSRSPCDAAAAAARRAAAAALLGAPLGLLLAGCATPPARPPGSDWLNGRLSLRVETGADATTAPRQFSSAFELQGDAERGELRLTSPLGSVVAAARWSPDAAVLVTSDGDAPLHRPRHAGARRAGRSAAAARAADLAARPALARRTATRHRRRLRAAGLAGRPGPLC